MDGSIAPFQVEFPAITFQSRTLPPPASLGEKWEGVDEYKDMTIEDMYLAVGEKLHFIKSQSGDDANREACKTFVGAYYRHLVTKSFLLLPGKAGLGKSTFAKEIASMVISKGGAEGYFYHMNNQELLTVDRLYGYSMGSQYVPGPLGQMIKDANDKPNSKFVLIFDEYNRGSDPVLLFAKVWDAKLRRSGPNERAQRYKYRRISAPGGADQGLPLNIKFIFAGNRQEDGCAGEVIEEDSALRLNRFAGSEVSFADVRTIAGEEYSLQKNGYPGKVMVENMIETITTTGYKGCTYSKCEIEDIIRKEQRSASCNEGEELMPGKIVDLVYNELDARIIAIEEGLDKGHGVESHDRHGSRTAAGLLQSTIRGDGSLGGDSNEINTAGSEQADEEYSGSGSRDGNANHDQSMLAIYTGDWLPKEILTDLIANQSCRRRALRDIGEIEGKLTFQTSEQGYLVDCVCNGHRFEWIWLESTEEKVMPGNLFLLNGECRTGHKAEMLSGIRVEKNSKHQDYKRWAKNIEIHTERDVLDTIASFLSSKNITSNLYTAKNWTDSGIDLDPEIAEDWRAKIRDIMTDFKVDYWDHVPIDDVLNAPYLVMRGRKKKRSKQVDLVRCSLCKPEFMYCGDAPLTITTHNVYFFQYLRLPGMREDFVSLVSLKEYFEKNKGSLPTSSRARSGS